MLRSSGIVLVISLFTAAVDAQVFEYTFSDAEIAVGPGGDAPRLRVDHGMVRTDSPEFASTQGFDMALRFEKAALDLVSIDLLEPLLTVSLGGPPDFFGIQEENDGWAVAIVYGFGTPILYVGGESVPLLRIIYDVDVSHVTSPGVVGTPLSFDNTVGTPPVSNLVTVLGQPFPVTLTSTTIPVSVYSSELFVRSDCNRDGALDIADGVTLLGHLFSAAPAPLCEAACDANADGTLDIADAIYSFEYLLFGGPPPPSPFPFCGGDDSGLTCTEFGACL